MALSGLYLLTRKALNSSFMHVTDDAVTGFILSTITAILMGIVVSMNIYIMKRL